MSIRRSLAKNMTPEEICMWQSETVETQAHLIVSLLREVMQYRELTEEERRIMNDPSWSIRQRPYDL